MRMGYEYLNRHNRDRGYACDLGAACIETKRQKIRFTATEKKAINVSNFGRSVYPMARGKNLARPDFLQRRAEAGLHEIPGQRLPLTAAVKLQPTRMPVQVRTS